MISRDQLKDMLDCSDERADKLMANRSELDWSDVLALPVNDYDKLYLFTHGTWLTDSELLSLALWAAREIRASQHFDAKSAAERVIECRPVDAAWLCCAAYARVRGEWAGPIDTAIVLYNGGDPDWR